MISLTKEISLAAQAAVEAGSVIIDVYNSKIDVEYKDDNSPLTVADQKANDVINSYLVKTDIPIISEENKQIDYDIRKEWNTCWIVDPLDGTKEFIKRNGEFTVNIALVENGKPLLGVIYVPVTKELYLANTSKKEAIKVSLSDHYIDDSILVSDGKLLTPGNRKGSKVRVVGSRSHMSEETLSFVESLKKDYEEVEIVSKGSSLKFCLVAEGLADVYPRFAPTMEWDTAAGQAICNAVGVEVISEETKDKLRYNKKNLLNPWFIVG